jgi:hypothetical protein
MLRHTYIACLLCFSQGKLVAEKCPAHLATTVRSAAYHVTQPKLSESRRLWLVHPISLHNVILSVFQASREKQQGTEGGNAEAEDMEREGDGQQHTAELMIYL